RVGDDQVDALVREGSKELAGIGFDEAHEAALLLSVAAVAVRLLAAGVRAVAPRPSAWRPPDRAPADRASLLRRSALPVWLARHCGAERRCVRAAREGGSPGEFRRG